MLTFTRLLLKHNECELFSAFLADQLKIYLSRHFVFDALESACRFMRPRMALKLLALTLLYRKSDDEKESSVDISNTTPYHETEVNIREIRETQMVVRCLQQNHEFKVKQIVSKVSEV